MTELWHKVFFSWILIIDFSLMRLEDRGEWEQQSVLWEVRTDNCCLEFFWWRWCFHRCGGLSCSGTASAFINSNLCHRGILIMTDNIWQRLKIALIFRVAMNDFLQYFSFLYPLLCYYDNRRMQNSKIRQKCIFSNSPLISGIQSFVLLSPCLPPCYVSPSSPLCVLQLSFIPLSPLCLTLYGPTLPFLS